VFALLIRLNIVALRAQLSLILFCLYVGWQLRFFYSLAVKERNRFTFFAVTASESLFLFNLRWLPKW